MSSTSNHSQQTKAKLTHLSRVTFRYHWCAPLGWRTKWDLVGVFFPCFHASVCLHVCFWVICFVGVIPFEYAQAINLSASCLMNCPALVRWTGLNSHTSLHRQNCWASTVPISFQPVWTIRCKVPELLRTFDHTDIQGWLKDFKKQWSLFTCLGISQKRKSSELGKLL